MNFKKDKASIIRNKQKELLDEFILDTEKISRILKAYSTKRKQFRNYSIGNLILAHYQLIQRNGEGVDLLAPYKKWETINRHVKYGEKALYILAPIHKQIKDEETDEVIETKLYFKKVPVFDLSQTEGEEFEQDYTTNNSNLTFEEIKNRIQDIPILESNKEITRGYTDGKKIWVSRHLSDAQKICVLFHELTHYYLHFDKNGERLTRGIEELEAESVSYMVASAIGITNDESSAYIKSWAGENSHDLIKGRGSHLIKTATRMIDTLNLNDNLVECA